MTEVHFKLHAEDGSVLEDQRSRCLHVPRVGDLITFGSDRSYQVVDVYWNLQPASGANLRVMVTAFATDRLAHLARIDAEWRASNG